MDGGRPARVADQIIDDLRKRERNGLIELPKRPGPKPGDQVRILQGPFAGQLGLYAGMRAHERVLVLLALLGGQQRVELPRPMLRRFPIRAGLNDDKWCASLHPIDRLALADVREGIEGLQQTFNKHKAVVKAAAGNRAAQATGQVARRCAQQIDTERRYAFGASDCGYGKRTTCGGPERHRRAGEAA